MQRNQLEGCKSVWCSIAMLECRVIMMLLEIDAHTHTHIYIYIYIRIYGVLAAVLAQACQHSCRETCVRVVKLFGLDF